MSSDDRNTLMMQAFVLRATDHPEAALKKCLCVIEMDHYVSEELLLMTAKLYLETGKAAAAHELLQRKQPQFADSVAVMLAVADAAIALGRYEEASHTLCNILTKEPVSLPALIRLRVLSCEADTPSLAKGAWHTALALCDKKVGYAMCAASLFGHFGHRNLAEEFSSQAESISPDAPAVTHLSAAFRDSDVPKRANPAYLGPLFDRFADSYDITMKSLHYEGPTIVRQMIERLRLPADGSLKILDCGCGTGLCGATLKPYAKRLTGVDLSAAMLEQAQNRGCYDETYCGDILAPDLLSEKKFDLIVSSDVLVYFGSLSRVLAVLGQALYPGGYLILTLEALPEHEARPWRLGPSGRYQHSLNYVDDVLHTNGFETGWLSQRTVLRHQYDTPVEGYAVAARRSDQ